MAAQLLRFIVVGGVQIGMDTLLFAVIFLLAGDPLLANVVSRGGAALVGFLLNRRYTFDARRNGRAGEQGLRYILLWLLLTTVSTILIGAGGALLAGDIHNREWMIGLKICIEATLAVLSFVGMRYGVFGRREK